MILAQVEENLSVGLVPLLEGHQVESVSGLGWSDVSIGELLDPDAMITMDRNIEHQQRLADLPLWVLVLRAPSNRMPHLLPW